jgi:hypothetical protein
VVQVAVVFPPDEGGIDECDLWELALVLDATGPREAINTAVSTAHDILDDSRNWLALGYARKPFLYAVRSVTSDIDFLRKANNHEMITILTKVASFTSSEVEKIKSLQDVFVSYHVMHVDSQ